MKTIVVTRHPALVDFLVEKGVITPDQAVETIATATPDLVCGNHVIGVLPIHLAALCDRFTNLAIFAPEELRGVELSLEQVRQYAQPAETYRVQKL